MVNRSIPHGLQANDSVLAYKTSTVACVFQSGSKSGRCGVVLSNEPTHEQLGIPSKVFASWLIQD